MAETDIELAVIGGGPAGLRAAETASAAGVRVVLFDAKPSVGRKFLVAGKGGLNLTHSEPLERFVTRYRGHDQPPEMWRGLLAEFSPAMTREWAAGLRVDTFVAASGRVYPTALKAAPLLRHWVARLKHSGVEFAMNRRWSGLVPGAPHVLRFADGSKVRTRAVVFALGGGSWPQTGSDAAWVEVFRSLGIASHPLFPANCGWEHPWPASVLAAADGKPLKNLAVKAGACTAHGELLVTRYGLEGGAIYQLGPALRGMNKPALAIDFKPTFTHEQLLRKMESVRRDYLNAARERWRLSEAAAAILSLRPWTDASSLATEVKNCVIELCGPRPLAEAISSAGGVAWPELDESLMLRRFPGVFLAGEMIDWEAPTGGYLLQGCLATGSRAGRAAAVWLQRGMAGNLNA